ncbi:hypothetical protein J7355_11335 [Endozoicomonas sp. G2_2]|uniref:hypothetical protein n=1 Tax=Gammaproteobacteria TaxID=1236 RepID=UPI001ADCB28E|nr:MULTISPECIES: hypothetical protein [Gammaproteobacteria]MBO9470694.1 hypothetical protein [Endozoicomonas sp. G2_2]
MTHHASHTRLQEGAALSPQQQLAFSEALRMCRFCLESALVGHLDELNDQELLDAFDPPIDALEEIDDLPAALIDLNPEKHALEVVIARVVEHYVLRGFDASVFEAVQNTYGHAAISAFFETSREAQPDSLGSELTDVTIYQHRKAWSRLMAQRTALVGHAKARLYEYLDLWCVALLWPADQHEVQAMPKVQPPAREETAANTSSLHARFIGDFAALAIVRRFEPDAPVIRSIVAAQPMHLPGFSTLGLWLQRRAAAHVVRHRGVDFLDCLLEVSDEFRRLGYEDWAVRNELFHYGVVTALLTEEGWLQLDKIHREYDQTKGRLPANGVSAVATQDVIDSRLGRTVQRRPGNLLF